MTTERKTAYNSTLPKVAVSCFVGQYCGYIKFSSSYERFSGENRHLRQAAKRCSAILNPLQNNENSYFDLVQNDIKS
jgi:hypothetical protein